MEDSVPQLGTQPSVLFFTARDACTSAPIHWIVDEEENTTDSAASEPEGENEDFTVSNSEVHHPTQDELDDLVRDLKLSKFKAELLGSRLKEWSPLLFSSAT